MLLLMRVRSASCASKPQVQCPAVPLLRGRQEALLAESNAPALEARDGTVPNSIALLKTEQARRAAKCAI